MEELCRTDDPVLLSWLLSRLDDEGIEALVFDPHTSSVFEGILPELSRRVMVPADRLAAARMVLAESRRINDGAGP